MDKTLLEQFISEGLTQRDIADRIGKARSSVAFLLKKNGLKTLKTLNKKDPLSGKVCKRCDTFKTQEQFYLRRDGTNLSPYCRTCSVGQTTERQRKLKHQCVEYKGGKCVKCGYDKCVAAFDFHHSDPTEKEFSICQVRTTKFDDKIKQELDKCILLCSNCHRETHFNQEAK